MFKVAKKQVNPSRVDHNIFQQYSTYVDIISFRRKSGKGLKIMTTGNPAFNSKM